MDPLLAVLLCAERETSVFALLKWCDGLSVIRAVPADTFVSAYQ